MNDNFNTHEEFVAYLRSLMKAKKDKSKRFNSTDIDDLDDLFSDLFEDDD